jgi:hypothetical protein
LKETLAFYAKTKINLLVLDNSPVDLDATLIPDNCTYSNSEDPFALRSAKAAKLIQTPFTIIGADDEIYLPSSLATMQTFLVDNPDYVAVGGCAVAVWKYGPTIAASWAYKKTYGYHNDAETPLDRIDRHTGHGVDPLTSFFTCNLTRTWAAQECLFMYAKAPVLATDAISVLTICGAGKSKYLDLVYWIRNWNQSPRSHSGWDRRVFLHEWWGDPANLVARIKFAQELSDVYSKYTHEDNFKEGWKLLLKSDEVLHRHISPLKNKMRIWSESWLFKNIKFNVKLILHRKSLPPTASQIAQELALLRISVPLSEFAEATSLVSKLRPYDSWK